ncbi:MAG: hypothetical protein DME15_01880 [Candidatus Rokuibacteriota bacterium]|nr:MAG: hypothetical protein DME15_01880 [Candidatus Rokubacteria bacterium]
MVPRGPFQKLATALTRWWPGIGAAVVTVAVVGVGWLEPLELRSLDRLFELRGARRPQVPIVIVTIDESSFTELNIRELLPRAMHASLIDKISAGRPLAIGVDLIFDTPSSRGPRDDEALGDAVARAGNVVLAAALVEEADVDLIPGYVVTRKLANAPIKIVRAGAAAWAPVNVPIDSDGHLRRARLSWRVTGETMLGFAARIHEVVTRAGLAVTPLPGASEVRINFRGGPKTFAWLSYYRALRGEIGPEAFRGKIVLIGATSPLMRDFFATPFAQRGEMPGIEILANVIETLVRGNPIREVPQWVSMVVAVSLTLLSSALVGHLRVWGLVSVSILWVVLTLGTLATFVALDVWIRSMACTLALVLGSFATVVVEFTRLGGRFPSRQA